MRRPRFVNRRGLIVIAVALGGVALLWYPIGDYFRRNAFVYAEAANQAMMTAAGLEAEATTALETNNPARHFYLQRDITTAHENVIYDTRWHRRYSKAAALMGMPATSYVPPGVAVPVPRYTPTPAPLNGAGSSRAPASSGEVGQRAPR